VDFIQNDPNFIPEIHLNNLEDAFMSIHSNQTAGFVGDNNENNIKHNDGSELTEPEIEQTDSTISSIYKPYRNL